MCEGRGQTVIEQYFDGEQILKEETLAGRVTYAVRILDRDGNPCTFAVRNPAVGRHFINEIDELRQASKESPAKKSQKLSQNGVAES